MVCSRFSQGITHHNLICLSAISLSEASFWLYTLKKNHDLSHLVDFYFKLLCYRKKKTPRFLTVLFRSVGKISHHTAIMTAELFTQMTAFVIVDVFLDQ